MASEISSQFEDEIPTKELKQRRSGSLQLSVKNVALSYSSNLGFWQGIRTSLHTTSSQGRGGSSQNHIVNLMQHYVPTPYMRYPYMYEEDTWSYSRSGVDYGHTCFLINYVSKGLLCS